MDVRLVIICADHGSRPDIRRRRCLIQSQDLLQGAGSFCLGFEKLLVSYGSLFVQTLQGLNPLDCMTVGF